MNFPLLCKLLSRITFLIAVAMVFSLPWAFPAIGGSAEFEYDGFFGLLGSISRRNSAKIFEHSVRCPIYLAVRKWHRVG